MDNRLSHYSTFPTITLWGVQIYKVVIIFTLIFAIGIGIYALLDPWFIPLLFPKYSAVEVIPLTTMSAAILITLPASLFSQHLEARGHAKASMISQWTASILFIGALFILIPSFGLMGAIISRGIYRLIYTILTMIFLLRLLCEKL